MGESEEKDDSGRDKIATSEDELVQRLAKRQQHALKGEWKKQNANSGSVKEVARNDNDDNDSEDMITSSDDKVKRRSATRKSQASQDKWKKRKARFTFDKEVSSEFTFDEEVSSEFTFDEEVSSEDEEDKSTIRKKLRATPTPKPTSKLTSEITSTPKPKPKPQPTPSHVDHLATTTNLMTQAERLTRALDRFSNMEDNQVLDAHMWQLNEAINMVERVITKLEESGPALV
jgi:hypothetical protein